MNQKLRQTLNLKPHFNIADSIPMKAVSDDGIIESAHELFSKSYRVTDINFGISKDEEKQTVVTRWSHVIKSLDPSYDLQICIYNHSVDMDYLSGQIFLEQAKDGKDPLRNDINAVIRKNAAEGNNGIRRDIYLTLTIPAESMQEASRLFGMAEHDILSAVRAIPGCGAEPLKAIRRLNLLHDMFRGGEESEFFEYRTSGGRRVRTFSMENMYRQGIPVSTLVQPDSMEYKYDHFILGKKYGRGFDLKELSTVLSDSFLRDFTSLPFNLIFTVNLHPIDPVKAHELVKAQRTNAAGSMAEAMKRASREGYDAALTNPDLATNFNEANLLLDEIERNGERLFETKLHMVIFADNKATLDKNCEAFRIRCRTRNTLFGISYGLQENTLLSAMPFGIDTTPVIRTLNTQCLSRMVPFASQEMTQKGGIVYGLNKVTHNIITFNRMTADSYNMLVLGFTGSGKSFFVKKEILLTVLNKTYDADVIIIDPQNEYGKLCRAVGGTEIRIKASGAHHINPLDISVSYGENPIAEKAEFLQSMMAEILNYRPDATQKSAISIAAMRCYDQWLKSGSDQDIPTLETFYDALIAYYNSNGGALASILDLIKAVEFYTEGTVTLFKGNSNVDTGSKFISYNIADLGESTRPLAMLVILDSILNRMSRNRKLNRPTFVYIDEIHLLFRKEQTAQWIRNLWKTARKYKCAPCGITQDCEDILSSEVGRSVLTNTSFVVLLKQAPINASVIADQLQLSQRQLEYVTDTPPGEGLLYIQNASRFTGGVIPFEDHYPEDSMLYDICQTSRSDEEE